MSDISTFREADPYTRDDLYRPADEGRSLHDDASRFYRDVMGLETPVMKSSQPDHGAICEALEYKVQKDDLPIWTIVYSMFQTERAALWSTDDRLDHSAGIFWRACRSYQPSALRYIHAVNLDDMASTKRSVGDISTVATPTRRAFSSLSITNYEGFMIFLTPNVLNFE